MHWWLSTGYPVWPPSARLTRLLYPTLPPCFLSLCNQIFVYVPNCSNKFKLTFDSISELNLTKNKLHFESNYNNWIFINLHGYAIHTKMFVSTHLYQYNIYFAYNSFLKIWMVNQFFKICNGLRTTRKQWV